MSIQNKISILKKYFPNFYIRKNIEFVTFCPKHFHHKKKLEINLQEDRFNCWVCSYGGSTIKLIKEYGNKQDQKEFKSSSYFSDNQEVEENLELPDGFEFIYNMKNKPQYDKCIEWLIDEVGILNVDTILQNKVGFCSGDDYKNRIVIPSFDEFGKLNYFITRSLYEDGPYKYLKCKKKLKSVVFNEIYVDWSKPLILIEAIKPYLKFFGAIENMTPLNGTSFSKEYKLFKKIVLEDCPEVIIALDSGTKKSAISIITLLKSYGIKTRLCNIDKQVDELSLSDMQFCIENSKELTQMDIMKHKVKGLYE